MCLCVFIRSGLEAKSHKHVHFLPRVLNNYKSALGSYFTRRIYWRQPLQPFQANQLDRLNWEPASLSVDSKQNCDISKDGLGSPILSVFLPVLENPCDYMHPFLFPGSILAPSLSRLETSTAVKFGDIIFK